MSQTARGDLSPPDGYRASSPDATDGERLGMIEGLAHDIDARVAEAGLVRDKQHDSLQRAIAAEAEARRTSESAATLRAGHLADGLMTVGAAMGETRQEVRSVARSLTRLGEDLADTKASLLGEMGKVHAALAGLRRQDSLTDITLAEVQGEVQKQGGALAKVGKELSLVNLARGVAIAVIAHPTSVVDLCKAAWHGLFG